MLLSGGVDSAVCLEIARATQQKTVALCIDYGQPHSREIDCASKLAEDRGIPLIHSRLPIRNLYGEPTPGRNAMFLAYACHYAASNGLHTVWIGCNATDAEQFPDCTEEFLRSWDEQLQKQGLEVIVRRPLIRRTKSEVLKLANDLNLDLSETWSCYVGGSRPCGQCLACRVLQEAQ